MISVTNATATKAIAFLSALYVLTAPTLAWACPSCAAQTGDKGGVGVSLAIAAFLVVPYAAVWAVVRFIKKGEAPAA